MAPTSPSYSPLLGAFEMVLGYLGAEMADIHSDIRGVAEKGDYQMLLNYATVIDFLEDVAADIEADMEQSKDV